MADEPIIHIEVCLYRSQRVNLNTVYLNTVNLNTVNSNIHSIRSFNFISCYLHTYVCKMDKGAMCAIDVQISFFFAKAAAKAGQRVFFRAIFLDMFLITFVRAF